MIKNGNKIIFDETISIWNKKRITNDVEQYKIKVDRETVLYARINSITLTEQDIKTELETSTGETYTITQPRNLTDNEETRDRINNVQTDKSVNAINSIINETITTAYGDTDNTPLNEEIQDLTSEISTLEETISELEETITNITPKQYTTGTITSKGLYTGQSNDQYDYTQPMEITVPILDGNNAVNAGIPVTIRMQTEYTGTDDSRHTYNNTMTSLTDSDGEATFLIAPITLSNDYITISVDKIGATSPTNPVYSINIPVSTDNVIFAVGSNVLIPVIADYQIDIMNGSGTVDTLFITLDRVTNEAGILDIEDAGLTKSDDNAISNEDVTIIGESLTFNDELPVHIAVSTVNPSILTYDVTYLDDDEPINVVATLESANKVKLTLGDGDVSVSTYLTTDRIYDL